MSLSEDSSDNSQPSSSVVRQSAQRDVYTNALSKTPESQSPRSESLQPILGATVDDEDADPTSTQESLETDGGSDEPVIRAERKAKAHDLDVDDHQVEIRFQDYEDRPSRYLIPSSTWRSWNQEERQIFESLVELRNRDLAAHLFNAHALKLRRRHSHSATAPDLTGADGFAPDRHWTAWPMPPPEVPRGTVGPFYAARKPTTYHHLQEARSSTDLEDCLIAHTLRIAKERFNGRLWEDEPDDDHISEPDPTPVTGVPLPPADPDNVPLFSSQAKPAEDGDDDDESTSKGRKQSRMNTPHPMSGSTKPTFLADDDEAREILIAATCETLAQLDQVLVGLHRARQAYVHDDADDVNPAKQEIRVSISRYRKKRRNSSNVRSAGDLINGSGDTAIESAEEEARSRSRGLPKRKASFQPQRARLRPRDWSDLLAVAATSGWDRTVLERTAKRCSALFDEDMRFRTFYEGDSQQQETSFFTEATAAVLEPGEDDIIQEVMLYDTDTTTERPFSVEGRYLCSHDQCRQKGRSYQNLQTLKNHMRNYHEIAIPSTRGRNQVASNVDQSGMSTNDELLAKVYCPVRSCLRHHEPFSRSTKMYTHVKKYHPELDVAEVKRMQAQQGGERRGRWNDERRHRSRSLKASVEEKDRTRHSQSTSDF